jgi:hypothetical protein
VIISSPIIPLLSLNTVYLFPDQKSPLLTLILFEIKQHKSKADQCLVHRKHVYLVYIKFTFTANSDIQSYLKLR